MATLKEIAALANVSVNTVSRVLNGKSKDAWPRAKKQADEIRAIARRLNYVPNSAARAMRTRKHMRVALVVSGNYSAPFDFEIAMGAEKILRERGYSISVISAEDLADGPPADLAFDGVLVRYASPPVQRLVENLTAACVWVDTNVFEPFNCLRRDEFHAGATAAAKLAELGYQRLLYVQEEYAGHAGDPHFCLRDRLAGVQEVADQRGLELEYLGLPNVRASDPETKVLEQESQICSKLHRRTAVIAMDFFTAQKIAFYAMANGLCAGRDFPLAACDELYKTRDVWPGLSRVRFERGRLGAAAAQMLLSLMNEELPAYPSKAIRSDWYAGKTAGPLAK